MNTLFLRILPVLTPRYLVFLVAAIFFVFGLVHLTKFVTADEHYWIYERIPGYFEAVSEGKWKKTLINDKPGITLALVSGTGLLAFPNPEEHCIEGNNKILRCDVSRTESLLLAFRLPILIINTLLLILSFFLLRRALEHDWIALFAITLIATSPILLGISQIVNPDALLWSLGSTTLFSVLAWLKHPKRTLLVLSGILFGFTLLTKYAALTLLPCFFILLVLFFLFDEKKDAEAFNKELRKSLLGIGLITLIAFALFVFFLPAILTNTGFFFRTLSEGFPPFRILPILIGITPLFALLLDTFFFKSRSFLFIRNSFQKHEFLRFYFLPLIVLSIGLILARHFFPEWDIFALIPFDMKDLTNARYYLNRPLLPIESFALEANTLLFTLTPWSLLGIALAWVFTSSHRTKFAFEITSLSLIALFFLTLLVFGNTLATPRYLIILFPFANTLAALGFGLFIFSISKHLSFRIFFFVLLILGSITLLKNTPFPFNYSNILHPKTSLLSDAWGYGGYEAAQYLNTLPDAKNLTVWADYYGVCEFFIGNCVTAYTFDQNMIRPDYYVLTRRGEIRYMSRYTRWERLSGLTAYRYYPRTDPTWSLFINENPKNFIKIFRVE